ncbi:MAG: hypothetical protein Q8M02_02140 [Candidatus Didemnitutus sp.]|nr:hypothetical protein [Candidatus Didemnitutus sp.]
MTCSEIQRGETGLRARPEVRVGRWFYFRGRGNITIHLSADEVARLVAGETIEFDGNALTRKKKLRRVHSSAERLAAASGIITVHIPNRPTRPALLRHLPFRQNSAGKLTAQRRRALVHSAQ